jgi:hypothetical protein
MKPNANLIYSLLHLRGISGGDVARLAGFNRHSIYKAIRPTPYRTANGKQRYRQYVEARAAIAAVLCVPYDHLWGPRSVFHLRRLIQREIQRRAAEMESFHLQAG